MTSPLTEANPLSLDELFSSSPLERSPQEMEIIVRALREKRALWAQEEASGKKSSTAGRKKAAEKKAPQQELSLDDLEL